ncbi:MAG: prephenate dehydratase [Myxococcales bacterium]|nr:prephenate dehydratase [Myxococcales bacterium]
MSDRLKELRDTLDGVDQRIVDALAERQRVVSEVTKLKVEIDPQTPLRDRQREEQILTRLAGMGAKAGLDRFFVVNVFRTVLEYSVRVQLEALVDRDNPHRVLERPIVVAYQGGEGAYSHLAGIRHFGARGVEVSYRGFGTFAEALEAVRVGVADYAMLPIENTTAGSINEAYDLLARMELSIVGEEIQPVEHCLVTLPDAEIDDIRAVFSHPQALAQCRDFLTSLSNCRIEAFVDTAMAVEKIKNEKDPTQAAIASEVAAKRHGLKILRRGIANQKENFTRMVVVAEEPVTFDDRIPCKTSLIIATKHEEGALLRCLNVFATHDLNLTKLESRPRPHTPWEYLFYVDIEGNTIDPRVQDAMAELKEHTSYVKLLGSYPARTLRKTQPASPTE